jgi:hypothetical protein
MTHHSTPTAIATIFVPDRTFKSSVMNSGMILKHHRNNNEKEVKTTTML